MTEADLMVAVVDMAAVLGWQYVHFRPAQTRQGWRTPVQGPLGKGWPDLFLLSTRRGRSIFAELKDEKGTLSQDQLEVQALLLEAGETYHVWRPADLDNGAIQAALT